MPIASDHLLDIQDLRTHFFTNEGVVKAVDGVTFSIPRGKTLCVVGESGSGKSMTARSILQIVDSPGRIVSGSIHFRPDPNTDIDLAKLPPRGQEIRAIRGKDITMIFQEPMAALSPLYTIGNQIMEAITWHLPVSRQEARERAIEALAKVGIPRPGELVDAYTFQLSGGMRQRAMIAMALVCEPKLLIADEPTTALDVTTQANTLDLIRGLQQAMGMSVLYITHDMGVVAEIADEVAVMYLGTIVERGSAEDVFGEPKHPYTQALLRSIPRLTSRRKRRLETIRGIVPPPLDRPNGCPFHTRCDFAVAGICDQISPDIYSLGGGREARCLIYSDPPLIPAENLYVTQAESSAPAAPPVPDAERQVLLQVSGLKMHFPITAGFFNRAVGHVKAVDGVSFSIYEGETLALVGESGSGKTTLGQSVMRLYDPTAGEMLYANGGEPVDLARLRHRQLKPYRREIRMVFQDPQSSLNPRLPVIEIIGESLKVNGIAKGAALEERVREMLRRVGLRPEYIHRYPHAFSGGERQRIGIARALAPYPRLVIADEAVSALDVSVQAQILNLLKDLQAEFGLTYLFISHDLSVVAHISDRIAVMYVGRIVELGPTESVLEQPQHPYTEALLSSVLTPDRKARAERARIRLEGEVADPANPPTGCAFHPRCRYAQDICRVEVPALRQTRAGSLASCHFAEELTLMGVARQDEKPSL